MGTHSYNSKLIGYINRPGNEDLILSYRARSFPFRIFSSSWVRQFDVSTGLEGPPGWGLKERLTNLLCKKKKKNIFPKPKEVKTRSNLAEYSKEGCSSKRAVLPTTTTTTTTTMTMMMMMISSETSYSIFLLFHIVTCIPIARQRVGEHIPATHEHAAMERLLLLGNGAVNRLLQYRLFSVRYVQSAYKKFSAGHQ
jgi:hypothetical protein